MARGPLPFGTIAPLNDVHIRMYTLQVVFDLLLLLYRSYRGGHPANREMGIVKGWIGEDYGLEEPPVGAIDCYQLRVIASSQLVISSFLKR